MPFFQGSSNLTIANSYFSEVAGDLNINFTAQESATFFTQLLGKRRERENSSDSDVDGPRQRRRCSGRDSDGLMIVKLDQVKLRTELISRNSYRIHSASHGARGRVVAVKVFEGPLAKQDWIKNVALLKKFFHSNMPNLIGVSDDKSEVPFVVFHGMCEKKIQPLIANALRTDLTKSVRLSMKAVKGLALENYDIFAGDNEEPIIAIHSTSLEDDLPSLDSHPFVGKNDDHGIEALNGLCQKLFSEVNSVLYDDYPKRDLGVYNAESLPQEVSQSPLNIGTIPTPSNSTQKPKFNRIPRRELQWRYDMGTNNRSLDSIARHFGDQLDLDCFLSCSSDSPLRRIRAAVEPYSTLQTSHRCPGYLREEITLTTDVSRSAIISHEYPSQSEICSVCGQLIHYILTPFALSYLDAIKHQFQDNPEAYNQFLSIMKDFKREVIDTPAVIERVVVLFHRNPSLIQGFKTFLPAGYRIDISPNLLTMTVTTPMGSWERRV